MYAGGLFIDGFAGGGGASTGIAQAIGRDPDVAINHSETAIAIHRANHPATDHHCTDIRIPMLPRKVTRERPVWGAWFSPDCKEYSKAKGGPVKDRTIRALCWEVPHWIEEVEPEVVYLENVEEFEYAAPLDRNGVPIAVLKGRDFQKFVRMIRRLGYRVEWRKLRACDYGAPTSRLRLYMVMRRDRQPVVWPKPTHAPANDNRVLSGELQPYRTAAECIDWSIHCPSIFERVRELAEATKRRIAHGVVRYVIEAARPFIVPVTHSGSWTRTHDSAEPLRTVTTANGGELAAVDVQIAPHITKFHSGSIGSPMDREMPAVTANGQPARPAGAIPLGLVSAFLSSFYKSDRAHGAESPLPTAMAGANKHAVVAAHMAQFNNNPDGSVNAGHDMRSTVSTIATKGPHQGVIETTLVEQGDLPPELLQRAVRTAAFLVKYYGTDGENEISQIQPVDRPLDAITTRARFAVVTVTIDARTYVIVDIGLRMLKPRELARAQGFPENYVLDPIVRKFIRGKWVERRLTIAEQISAIGNSVCPPVARALVAANQPGLTEWREAA